MSKSIFLVAIISFSAACGFFTGQQTKSSANSETPDSASSRKPDLLKILRDENVRRFQSWEDHKGKEFFIVVRQLNEPCDKDYDFSSCQQLSIYDDNGRVVHELREFGIGSIDIGRLKPDADSSQFIVTTDGGGTNNSLEILDYKDGKFVKFADSTETQFRGGYWMMPEYRSGMKAPYFKPEQLIVIRQIGGTDENPAASIFRYRENKFQKVGEISMQKLGDFIERQIAENK